MRETYYLRFYYGAAVAVAAVMVLTVSTPITLSNDLHAC